MKYLGALIILFAVGSSIYFLSKYEPASDAPERKPHVADVLRSFQTGQVTVAEFRDSSGRICVLASTASGDGRGGRAVALDCAYATDPPIAIERLPPLDYEALPSYEKRPL
jgi:hypothetical protein